MTPPAFTIIDSTIVNGKSQEDVLICFIRERYLMTDRGPAARQQPVPLASQKIFSGDLHVGRQARGNLK